MTTKTFLVNFELTRTLTYNQKEYKVEIETDYNEDEKLLDNELEDLIKDIISDRINNDDCDLEAEDINISKMKEWPTLDQMRPTECLKCEVFNNVCKKCVYYINNKCEGK